MKARDLFFYLIVVGLASGMLTYFALRWAITSYVEPTCQRYAGSQGLLYAGYSPPGLSFGTDSPPTSRDGNCQLREADGALQTYSLVSAGRSGSGAPLLVSLALGWEVVFLWTFLVLAFFLALVLRLFKRKMPIP